MEYISKAYQALTDPVSRENFEKYGHPDGRKVGFIFFPPSITQEETLLLCFLCVEVGKLIYLNMYH